MLLKLAFDADELILKLCAAYSLVVHLLEEPTKQSAHMQDVLQCLHYLRKVKEALVSY